MVGIAVIVLFWIYFQVIASRDKRDRKRFREIGRMIEAEKKRRVREEKLRLVRVKHPKVVYLDDHRHSQQAIK